MTAAPHPDDLRDDPGVDVPRDALRGYSRGRTSVARPLAHWYVVCPAAELRDGLRPTQLFGVPLVLFRDAEGRAVAMLDRCPHRNVPLSLGRVVDGQLECAYHGWRFDGGGACRFVPSLKHEGDARARNGTVFPTRELDGFVWVMPTAGIEPSHEPYRFRLLDDPSYTVVRRVVEAPASLHATLENALDVPHTAFLHKGLFRTESRGITIRADVRRYGDRVEAEYVGEPRPSGLVGRMLSPSGGMVTHFDRFIVPCIAEVEYRIGDENHVLVAAAMTPVEDWKTRVHAVVAVRTRLPTKLLAPVLLPFALRIFDQDRQMLERQTERIREFGGEQYASTEIDVLGKHILRLLRAAERGEVARDGALLGEESVELVV